MRDDEIDQLAYRPCVGLMVINHAGLIWAGQRIDGPSGAWQMPQGGIDRDEAPIAAAYRELEEETSISPEAVSLLAETEDWIPYDLPRELVGKLWKGRYRGQKQKWFLMRFDGDDADIEIGTSHPEFSDWRWMTFGELLDHIVPFKRGVYQAVQAAFAEQLLAAARG